MTGRPFASDVAEVAGEDPEIQSQYCWTTGSSRFELLPSSASDSGVALRPRIERAGSPGSAWVAAKMT